MGLSCPGHTTNTTNNNDTTVTTSDTGGDTGHIPPTNN